MVESLEQTQNLNHTINDIQQIFKKAMESLEIKEEIAIVSLPYNTQYEAQYQCPSAVKIYNKYKKQGSFGCKDPKELGQKIATATGIQENHYLISKINVDDKGFIYIIITESYMIEQVNKIIKHGIHIKTIQPKKIAVDFSSPNIAKDMHIGHLRSTIIGESICRIFECIGHEVLRINHLGDWGTQFGMLVTYMQEKYPDFQKNRPNLSDLQEFYKEAKKRFDQDENFKKQSQLNVVKLQKYDEDIISAWKLICDISLIQIHKIYEKLDIKIEDVGESFYNSRIPDTVKELKDKGLVTEDKGAQCIFLKNFQIPLMVVKSDGGFNYDSTDMAAVRYRLLELKCDRIVYITDLGQQTHFHQIFEAAKLAGWHQPPKTQLDHMGFGVVLGEDGKRMKSRSGDTVKLTEVLEEAAAQALISLQQREKDKEGQTTNLEQHEYKDASEKIGIAAIKYYDLRQSRTSDYKFDYKKMIDFKGDTSVYLFYSYARVCSIIRKYKQTYNDFDQLISQGFKFTHQFELKILSLITKFYDCLEFVVQHLEIHRLCDLLYNMCVKLSESYEVYRVLQDENRGTRVLLMDAVRQIMEKSFYLIGIKPIDKI